MAKYALSRYFAKGRGHAIRFHGSDTLIFYWNGRAAGTARFIPHVKRYARNGQEYPSLAALLRAVEAAPFAPFGA